MAYINDAAAVITEPHPFYLSGAPNFLLVGNAADASADRPEVWRIPVKLEYLDPGTGDPPVWQGGLIQYSALVLTFASGTVLRFSAVFQSADAGGTAFLLSPTKAGNALALAQALRGQPEVTAAFDVATDGEAVVLTGRGTSLESRATITTPDDPDHLAYGALVHTSAVQNDSLRGDAATADIGVEVTLGHSAAPTVLLEKTYAGQPVWFDIAPLTTPDNPFNVPPSAGWADTGTAQRVQLQAIKEGVSPVLLYSSDALWALNGYARPSESGDLTPYVYQETGTVQLLTRRPRTLWIPGQPAFLNFILNGAAAGKVRTTAPTYTLSVTYRLYTSGGTLLDTVRTAETLVWNASEGRDNFAVVNTRYLDIEGAIQGRPQVRIVRVCLTRKDGTTYTDVSNSIEWEVGSACGHHLLALTFLNRLGGWDAFNFDGTPSFAIETDTEGYTRAVTPSHTWADGVELVAYAEQNATVTVTGAPQPDEVLEWLAELAASRAVFDGQGRRVIIDELTLSTEGAEGGRARPVIKYHLSESLRNG